MATTTTSVSIVLREAFAWPCSAAWHTCSIIHVSASSWWQVDRAVTSVGLSVTENKVSLRGQEAIAGMNGILHWLLTEELEQLILVVRVFEVFLPFSCL